MNARTRRAKATEFLIETHLSYGWVRSGSAKTKAAALAGMRTWVRERQSTKPWRVVKVYGEISER